MVGKGKTPAKICFDNDLLMAKRKNTSTKNNKKCLVNGAISEKNNPTTQGDFTKKKIQVKQIKKNPRL